MKRALVLGAGGFIGSHIVRRLKKEGFWVRGVDLKYPCYEDTPADDFIVGDLRDLSICREAINMKFDEVYQLAADMGGAGYIFVGVNDYDVMQNSAVINLNVLETCRLRNVKRIFFSSSACMYPENVQINTDDCNLPEHLAYPAAPDSEYGWEKLFSERLYLAAARNKKMQVRVARYHNIFGERGSWNNGKEKAPAALCRKVAMADVNGVIDVWGDGMQTRSFLHVDECVEATLRLMRSDFTGPVNIGSDEMISINGLVKMIDSIAKKNIKINNIPGPLGVKGRNSDNTLYEQKIGWRVSEPLINGIERTYKWINEQVKLSKEDTSN